MKITYVTALLLLTVSGLFFYDRAYWYPLDENVVRQKTVDEVITDIGQAAEVKLTTAFDQVSFSYPPEKISLIAIKDTNLLELWAHSNGTNKKIKTYSIQAASGVLGPKLREGDFQVPEGIYRINAFNPNSSYHLSMKLNYPNAFDLKYANSEGRTEPGSDIFIHGKAVSIGCLAMGDEAIEELFTLVHKVGRPNVTVIITPNDPETGKLSVPDGAAHWVSLLYESIGAAIEKIRA